MGIIAVRTPGPVVVVINPAAIVIRRPAPRLVPDPGPTVWIAPEPRPETIRRPVAEVVDDWHVTSPDQNVVVGVTPTPVCIEDFLAPTFPFVVTPALLLVQSRGE